MGGKLRGVCDDVGDAELDVRLWLLLRRPHEGVLGPDWMCVSKRFQGKYSTLPLTSESLPPRPASLFRREAGAGRLAQLEGAALTNGVDRWRLDVSNTESRKLGVFGGKGGPLEGGRLGGR